MHRTRLSWEGIYPYVMSAALTLAVSRLAEDTPNAISSAGFNVSGFFGVLQNIELFGTGILFSIFVFTMAPAAGFIAKLQESNTFKVFRRYVVEAMVLGLLGIVFVAPLANASSPSTFSLDWMPSLIITEIYFAIAFVLSIFRVVRVFLFWSRQ